MNEFSILQRVRADIPERSDESVQRGRARLLEAMRPTAETATRRPSPSRRRAWLSYSLVGAAAVGAFIVAGVVVSPGGADPAAADVLTSAADMTVEFSDPKPGPGQFLQIRTDARYIASGSLESSAVRAPESEGGTLLQAESASYAQNYRDELFVPADRSQDWVWVQCQRSTAETFGPQSEALAKQTAEADRKYMPSTVRTYPAGQLPGSGRFDAYSMGSDSASGPADFADLPREPRALLQRIYDINGSAGQSRDGQALVWIADTLRKGTVPADLRASMYRTAALIPGVTITDERAALDGRAGVAIGRVEQASNVRQDLLLDTTTGLFIGERRVALGGDGDLPAGTVLSSSVVTTTVVDAAPSDTSAC